MMRKRTIAKRHSRLLADEFGDGGDIAVSHKRLTDEELFGQQCRSAGLPPVTPQWLFAKNLGRRWRFDYAFLPFKLAVEIEGISVMPRCRRCYPLQFVSLGGHASPSGMRQDMEKYNTAALLGWTVLRFESHDVKPRHALNMTLRLLAARGWVAESNTHTDKHG